MDVLTLALLLPWTILAWVVTIRLYRQIAGSSARRPSTRRPSTRRRAPAQAPQAPSAEPMADYDAPTVELPFVHMTTPIDTLRAYNPDGVDPAGLAALGRGRRPVKSTAPRPAGWPAGTEAWRA